MFPTDLEKKDNHLIIKWDDGHESLYDLRELRKRCPCATCRSSKTKTSGDPLRILTSDEVIKDDLQLQEAEIVGRYAIQFRWNDGHSEGIYSFDYLRRICQCNACMSS